MDNNNIPKEVISLIRFSSAEQTAADRAGIEGQRKVNQDAAKYHQLRIRKEVVVVDVSGRHVNDDPQFQELFQDLQDPKLAGVVVSEQSRIFRPENFSDFAILDHFSHNRKLVFTPSDAIDARTPMGRMNLMVSGYMSGEELHNMKARFQRAFRVLREEGKHTGNHLTVPRTVRYVRDRDANGKVIREHWELVPEAVERIKQAFHLLFTTNDSYDTIALKVGWSGGNALRRLMQNPIHVGIRRYTIIHDGPEYKPEPTLKHPKPKKRKRQRNREIPVDYPTREEIETGQRQPIVEPILTWAEWDKAEALFRERAANPKKRRFKEDDSDRPRFLAQGIGYCSCGQPLYAQQSAHRLGRQYGNYDHYKCHSRRPKTPFDRGPKPGCGAANLRRADLDGAVETLVSKLADEDFILAAVKTIVDQQEEAPDPGRAIREQARKDFQAGRRNLLRLVQENKITSQEFAEHSAELEQKLKALEAMTPAPIPKLDPLEIAERIARVFVSFQFMAYKDKRNVLSGAVKRIIVDTTTRRIIGVTVSGGYLGHGATTVNGTVDPVHRRRTPYQIDRTPDLILVLPKPIEIPKLARAA